MRTSRKIVDSCEYPKQFFTLRKNRRRGANDFSVLNPIIWANEAVTQLVPNMIVGNLMNRDFSANVAKFGDIVNALVPATFSMTRKGALCDDVQVQDASLGRVQLQLNQWPQVAFMICDGEEDRPALDLISTLLPPAVLALSEGIDRILGAQVYKFLDAVGGHLGQLNDTNVKDYVLETREVMNRNNVPLAGRTMILTPGSETEALKLDNLVTADKTGDGGTALANAQLGRKYGFNFVMTQTQPEVNPVAAVITAAVNHTGGYAAGATSVAYDTGVGAVAAGQWALIAGDDTPQWLSAATDVSNAGTLTLSPGLKRSVADNAVITIVTPGAVNNSGGYNGTSASPTVIGYAKEILTDGWTAGSLPQLGQMISFGTDVNTYTITKLRIISSTTCGIQLDQPLVLGIADNATINPAPAGKYNFAFLPSAFVMVTRAIAAPRPGTGASAYVVNDPVNKISLRVTISYDSRQQGHLVVIDTLLGVGTLNPLLGAVMLG